MKKVIKPFAIILSNCLLMAQVKTVPNQVKVAYIGIQVENVESWVKSELETKLNANFTKSKPAEFTLKTAIRHPARKFKTDKNDRKGLI